MKSKLEQRADKFFGGPPGVTRIILCFVVGVIAVTALLGYLGNEFPEQAALNPVCG